MMVAEDVLKIAKLEGQIEVYKEIIAGLRGDLAKARQPTPWAVTYGPGTSDYKGGRDSNANTE